MPYLALLKKKVPYTGCPTNIVMEVPCNKKLQETTKSADKKKTETEKNRADIILVFLLHIPMNIE